MPARRSLLLAALLLFAAGCSSSSGTTEPGDLTLAIFEGNNQTAIGHQQVAIDPAVLVTEDGAPKAGVTVTFAITAGGGTLVGDNRITDANGVARVEVWELGAPGSSQQLTATLAGAEGSPVQFNATSIIGPPVALQVQAGANQDVTVGQAAPINPVVRVVDAGNNAVRDAALTWEVVEGNGSVVAPDAATNTNGTGTVGSWIFGELAGEQVLAVHVNCPTQCAPALFTGTALPSVVSSIEKVAGDLQNASTGAAVTVAPRVLLKDIFGNAVPGAPVSFAVALGGGAVTGATPTSNATGFAEVGSWTLGAAGTNELTASSNGVTVTFTATATAPFDPAPFAGSYAGTWTNTTFSSVGTGTAVITVNTANHTATVTATATGNVLGGGPASPPLQNGTYTGTGAQFTGNVAPMGDITASIVAPGNITASAINVPSGSITGWTATGTINGTTIQLNFTVTFTAGPPAVGTITLTRQ